MAGSAGLAEQVALSIGQGAVSEQVASQLQEALPEVSFLRSGPKLLLPRIPPIRAIKRKDQLRRGCTVQCGCEG